MAKFVKTLKKEKTDKDYVLEAIKEYINRFGTKKAIPKSFSSLSLGDNLKELLYQNRLHTFGKNKITWDEFNDKCHAMFTIGYVLDKHISYEITLFKIDGLYKTIEYVTLYKKFFCTKTDKKNVYTAKISEYKVFSIRKLDHDKSWESKFWKGCN